MPGEKDLPPPLINGVCTECGAEIPESYGNCDALFMSILTNRVYQQNLEHPLPHVLCQLVVDTFAMQHPKRACKSAKSYAAHLTRLCCGVEYNGSKKVYAAIQRWLNGHEENIGISRPVEPVHRGKLTIRYIHDAQTSKDFSHRIEVWSESVWTAYAEQHSLAHYWISCAQKYRI